MYVPKTQYAKGVFRSSKLKDRQYNSKRKGTKRQTISTKNCTEQIQQPEPHLKRRCNQMFMKGKHFLLH